MRVSSSVGLANTFQLPNRVKHFLIHRPNRNQYNDSTVPPQLHQK